MHVLYNIVIILTMKDGYTALHAACTNGHVPVAEALIKAHVPINSKTKVIQYNMITYTQLLGYIYIYIYIYIYR